MEIVKLSENTMKVHISYKEMKHFGVSFESLQTEDLSTKLFFSMIYNYFGENFAKDVYVEIFDLGENGCILYFSNKKSKNTTSYLIIETENPLKLFEFAKKLKEINKTYKSSLYCCKNCPSKFRILIENSRRFCKEFSSLVIENFKKFSDEEILHFQTVEHTENWALIIKNNAMEVLSEVT